MEEPTTIRLFCQRCEEPFSIPAEVTYLELPQECPTCVKGALVNGVRVRHVVTGLTGVVVGRREPFVHVHGDNQRPGDSYVCNERNLQVLIA